MGDKSKIPRKLKEVLKRASERSKEYLRQSKVGKSFKRITKGEIDFDVKKFDLSNFSKYTGWFRMGVIVFAIFLLSGLVARFLGVLIKPSFVPPTKGTAVKKSYSAPGEQYNALLTRNMFNVEGKIPDPFDQGMLDCFSQARPSTQRIQLLGTIVMNDENFSVALLQEDGNPTKIGVKKDDVFFDGKFQALKIERKRFCFQVRSSQDFEYIDIPDNDLAGPSLTTNLSASEGITPVSENQFLVDQNFLEKNLLNLNEILQTARAVPYLEPGTGKFKGFLVQSIENTSPFAKLGVKQGDILTGVNDVVFDNAGKSLEAFQKFRNSPKISLEIIRGGQKTTKVYDVKN